MINMASLNYIKYKGYINPDYSAAYAIIKCFNLTPKDKEKIKEMNMPKSI